MGSHSKPKGHAGKAVMGFIDKLYDQTPGFEDIFDEESFYVFAGVFTLVVVIAAFVASRYITIKNKEDWSARLGLNDFEQLKFQIIYPRYEHVLYDVCASVIFW